MISIFKSDEAVSESVGYIILIGILTTVIAITLMIGYPIFQSSIQDGHMQNMQEAIYLLSVNANKVAMYEAPSQSAEIKLNGGTLWVHDSGYFNISCYGDTAGNNLLGYDNITPLIVMEYSLNNKKVGYILGGVCSKEGDSSQMQSEPSIYNYTDTYNQITMVVPLTTFQNTWGAISGTGTSRIIINSPYYSKTSNSVYYPNATRYDGVRRITIAMDSDYNQCFKLYFENSLGFHEVSDSDGVFVVEKDYTAPITLYMVPSELSVDIK